MPAVDRTGMYQSQLDTSGTGTLGCDRPQPLIRIPVIVAHVGGAAPQPRASYRSAATGMSVEAPNWSPVGALFALLSQYQVASDFLNTATSSLPSPS